MQVCQESPCSWLTYFLLYGSGYLSGAVFFIAENSVS